MEKKVREELKRVLGGRPPTHEDISQLTYTRMVIDEVLRVYPSVWGFAREAAEEDALGNYTIPKGSVMMLCPWVSHRNPVFWENPERFHPDRIKLQNKFAYFPFSVGPRQCIGNHMALQEAVLVLATLLQKFHLSHCDDQIVEPIPAGTTRPKHSLMMLVRNIV